MPKLRYAVMWAGLLALLLLAALSIVASFLGAERARAFFNSAPAAVFWVIFVVLMVASLAAFPRIWRLPCLFLLHLGALLILVGAMWGSPGGHYVHGLITGKPRIIKGFMRIPQGRAEDTIVDQTLVQPLGHLDFKIALERFWIEHYPQDPKQPWQLVASVITRDPGSRFPRTDLRTIKWKPKRYTALPFTKARVRVDDYFLSPASKESDAPVVPVVRLTFDKGDGSDPTSVNLSGGAKGGAGRLALTGLYKGKFEWHKAGTPTLFLQPPPPVVKDYKSTLAVLRDGKEVARKTIEVNAPLHYGGYHFYQYNYDRGAQRYTVLAVTSDAGVSVVYAGFLLLCAGTAWRCFMPRRRDRRAKESDHDSQA